MPETPKPPTAYPRTIPTLMMVLAAVGLIATVGWLAGCDESAGSTSRIRRDQLDSEIRSYTPPAAGGPSVSLGGGSRPSGAEDDDLASEVRVKLTGGNITLTAESDARTGSPLDLIHRATVEVVDDVATCTETGETLDAPHLIGADLRSGLLVVEDELGATIECQASGISHEIGHNSGRPPVGLKPASYRIYVGDVGP